MNQREHINCPYCNHNDHKNWADDNGFSAVKCNNCGFVYVNPRPNLALVDEAVKSGAHSSDANNKDVVTHRVQEKVSTYVNIFKEVFADVWESKRKISWLDVGAGFGEIVEAVQSLATESSKIEGVEPMGPKVKVATSRGLKIHQMYLSEVSEKYDFVSIINVFSHIPNFHEFLVDAKNALKPGGEIFIETGDTADFERNKIPGEIDLPDHLVFASEKHIRGFLEQAGFSVVSVKKVRIDSFFEFLKDIVKKIIGRPIVLRLPYTSPYRTMFVRAKLNR
jgi:predicted TPR repeat methyltransferase